MIPTLMENYARLAVTFVRGEGARLWDSEGVEYLDFVAGLSVCNVGHCHPDVVAAIREQAGELLHVSNLYYNRPVLELADQLSELSLGGSVFFCNSGAEANEAAIKLARKARPGGEVVVVRDAFHGRTYGALSATPQESKQAPFAPLVPGFVAVPADPQALRAAVGPQTAAILVEPIQGEAGVRLIDDEFLRAARSLCNEVGAALIFDEIQTGMGRTGRLWAYEHSGVVPDLMTVAKALAGGLPIGALICRPQFSGVLTPGDHGTTFGGGPLVCRAALAALSILRSPGLHERVSELGERLKDGLARLPAVTAVRGRGLMVAAELDRPAPDLVRAALSEKQLLINAPGPTTLRFLPPLVIGAGEVDDAIARLASLM